MNNIEIQTLLSWITQHSSWALAIIFLTASAESLAVVGLIVPGAAVMVAAGTLISLGTLEFWPTVLVAVAGAITGDGISYSLGHHYRTRIRTIWPFRRYTDWLSRGERFFHRHGGKSVLFGRFVGPVRPIIPVVAGMLGMRPMIFYVVNILSALAWAPAYLLPGMAFGASLSLANEVAARLALLLGLFAVITILGVRAIRWISRVLAPRASRLAEWLVDWSSRHPRVNVILGGLLNPARPEARALLLLGILLIGSGWLFLGIMEDIVTGDPLVRTDQGLYQAMQGLRTPWGDKAMVLVTELGDGVVISLVSVAILTWLLWHKNWRAAGYWVAAFGFGRFTAFLIKWIVQRPRPVADLYNGLSSYAFPSGHATMSMVVYGFLAVLIAGLLPRPRHWFVYAVAAVLICAIATSRLYLGAHWLSDVIGGLSLGLAWVCLLAIAYYRHPVSTPPAPGLPAAALIVLAMAGVWHVSMQYSADLQRYAPREVTRQIDAAAWWQKDWRQLPVYRQDLEGVYEQPLNVQWAGSIADLHRTLIEHGWHDPVSLKASTALHWLAPGSALEDLALLPQVHAGRHADLQMIDPLQQSRSCACQLVIRLWKSNILLNPDGKLLWIGYVDLQKRGQIAFLTMPVGQARFEEALNMLARTLGTTGLDLNLQQREKKAIRTGWTGDVLLVRNHLHD